TGRFLRHRLIGFIKVKIKPRFGGVFSWRNASTGRSAHAFRSERPWAGREYYSTIAVEERAVMDMRVDCTRQNLRFHVTADRHVVGGALCVRDTRHVLLDDRTFIKISRHVMRG